MNINGQASKNLMKAPGGPSIAAIESTNSTIKSANAAKNYVVAEGGEQGSNEFPYIPYAPDSYDDIAQAKIGLPGDKIVTLDRDDAEYMLRQKAQIDNANFDRWIMQKYDLTDPAQNFLMQQIAPEQFQRRLDLIDYQQSLVSKYARIRLLGAKNQEDLKFEWLVETGRIELPEGPIWDPVRWMTGQLGANQDTGPNRVTRSDNNRERFVKGLWNPVPWPNNTTTGWQYNAANPADIRGVPGRKTEGQGFTGVNAAGQAAPYVRYGRDTPFTDSDLTLYANNQAGYTFGLRRLFGPIAEGPVNPGLFPAVTAAEQRAYEREKQTGYGRSGGDYVRKPVPVAP